MPAGPGNDFWLRAAWPAMLVVAAIGLLDDIRQVSATARLLVHIGAGIYLLTAVQVDFPGPTAPWLLAASALFYAVWMTNVYNFMDGSNGMAASQAIFAGGLFSLMLARAGDGPGALVGLAIAAAAAGFLPWNLGRARLFMGDVGATFLGFGFAALSIHAVGHAGLGVVPVVLVFAVFGIDGGCTLAARVLRGERWYTAHRQHLYQRLMAHGWPHGRVLLLYQAINLLVVLPAVIVTIEVPSSGWPIALGTVLTLGMAWYLTIRRVGATA